MRTFNVAVSDKTKHVRFQEEFAYGHITGTEGVETLAIALDDFLCLHPQDRIDFIKIDVEGFELDVLCGSTQLLKRFSPLVYMELNSWCILGFTENNPKQVLSYIFDNFKYVAAVNDNEPDLKKAITPYNAAQINSLLARNLLHERCVSNLLMTNNDKFHELFNS